MSRILVERAMAGDHDAFSELTHRSIAKLYAIARLIARDDELAEDAVQEALVAAWRWLPRIRDPERFDAWMRRLLVHACYREVSRSKRRRAVESSVRLISDTLPDPGVESALRDQLSRGFERLSPEQRALLVLRYHLGLSMQEIADVVGHPVGTVKSRLSRATQQMRAALEADARTPVVQGRIA
jgi:RNA polymerase sigma-70 factor (ECF subfamily)